MKPSFANLAQKESFKQGCTGNYNYPWRFTDLIFVTHNLHIWTLWKHDFFMKHNFYDLHVSFSITEIQNQFRKNPVLSTLGSFHSTTRGDGGRNELKYTADYNIAQSFVHVYFSLFFFYSLWEAITFLFPGSHSNQIMYTTCGSPLYRIWMLYPTV